MVCFGNVHHWPLMPPFALQTATSKPIPGVSRNAVDGVTRAPRQDWTLLSRVLTRYGYCISGKTWHDSP